MSLDVISALNIGDSDLLHGGLHQSFSTCEDFGVKVSDNVPREKVSWIVCLEGLRIWILPQTEA